MYRMGSDEFNILVSDTFDSCKNTLTRKAIEYSRGSRLHNFHVAAQMIGSTPEKVLMGFKLKHDVSLRDIVNDIDEGRLPTVEMLAEKLHDEINYLVLLKALIVERRMNEGKCD